jgi:hypothetical protein
MTRPHPWTRFVPSRWRASLSRLRDQANRHPRRSAALLVGLLALHTALVLRWPDPAPTAAALYGSLLQDAKPSPPSGDRPGGASIPFTLGNYRAVRDLLDTLEYLRARPVHSRADTLRFLRLVERYARLDTAFARRLQASDRTHNPSPSTHRP